MTGILEQIGADALTIKDPSGMTLSVRRNPRAARPQPGQSPESPAPSAGTGIAYDEGVGAVDRFLGPQDAQLSSTQLAQMRMGFAEPSAIVDQLRRDQQFSDLSRTPLALSVPQINPPSVSPIQDPMLYDGLSEGVGMTVGLNPRGGLQSPPSFSPPTVSAPGPLPGGAVPATDSTTGGARRQTEVRKTVQAVEQAAEQSGVQIPLSAQAEVVDQTERQLGLIRDKTIEKPHSLMQMLQARDQRRGAMQERRWQQLTQNQRENTERIEGLMRDFAQRHERRMQTYEQQLRHVHISNAIRGLTSLGIAIAGGQPDVPLQDTTEILDQINRADVQADEMALLVAQLQMGNQITDEQIASIFGDDESVSDLLEIHDITSGNAERRQRQEGRLIDARVDQAVAGAERDRVGAAVDRERVDEVRSAAELNRARAQAEFVGAAGGGLGSAPPLDPAQVETALRAGPNPYEQGRTANASNAWRIQAIRGAMVVHGYTPSVMNAVDQIITNPLFLESGNVNSSTQPLLDRLMLLVQAGASPAIILEVVRELQASPTASQDAAAIARVATEQEQRGVDPLTAIQGALEAF